MIYRKTAAERLQSFASGISSLLNPLNLWKTLEGLIEFRTPGWALARVKAAKPEAKPELQHWINPVYWLWWTGSFALEWLRTRPYLNLPLAIPSVIV